MMTTYIAEDIPDFRLTGATPPAIMREEDHALSVVMVAKGDDETQVRLQLSLYLIRCANMRHVIADGRKPALLAASNAFTDGVDMVGVGNRVYRIREES